MVKWCRLSRNGASKGETVCPAGWPGGDKSGRRRCSGILGLGRGKGILALQSWGLRAVTVGFRKSHRGAEGAQGRDPQGSCVLLQRVKFDGQRKAEGQRQKGRPTHLAPTLYAYSHCSPHPSPLVPSSTTTTALTPSTPPHTPTPRDHQLPAKHQAAKCNKQTPRRDFRSRKRRDGRTKAKDSPESYFLCRNSNH